MAVLPIVTGKDTPVLRKKAAKVPKVTKEILSLIKDMEQTTVAAEGLGLAAPQIGQSMRLCIVRMHGKLTPLINPDILWRSSETTEEEEGCLSLPETFVYVTRAKGIVVRYTDAAGQEREQKLEDMDARVVQHEVDHLNGVLIVDYVKNAASVL